MGHELNYKPNVAEDRAIYCRFDRSIRVNEDAGAN